MNTQTIKTLMISAYLSAMLASNMPAAPGRATLASPLDADAAQKAFRSAIADLNANGWSGVTTQENRVSSPLGKEVSGTPSIPESVISEELMGRLIRRALANQKAGILDMKVCKIFRINDGQENLPAKHISTKTPESDYKHILSIPLKEDYKDVIISFNRGDVVDVYLTDKTGTLRAAAIYDLSGIRLILNEQATEKFAAEMKIFAEIAKTLPPTVVSNS